MGTTYNLLDLAGRILISVMFLESGAGKILKYNSTAHYMQSHGVPAILLPLVIALEIVGSIGVILGYKTRLFAFLLAGFCILAPLLFHSNVADQTQWLMFMKDIAIAGGFLAVCARGAGDFSMDKRAAHR
ncbi:MAG TPA: DoxX family protein [Syntrophorhabdales bacterium]|nr:DoxX family protein [Syntrophorhabdales bacterium]